MLAFFVQLDNYDDHHTFIVHALITTISTQEVFLNVVED